MIIGVGETTNREVTLNFGTHNGIFHCDEVVGVAILEIAHLHEDAHVVRTRDSDELKKAKIIIDIGGGEFDHHIAGFNLRRPTGEKYASAGLVWAAFAEKVIKNVMAENAITIDDDEIQKIKQQIDSEIITLVDMEDNGEKVTFHTFSFISKFLPAWIETPDYDKAFHSVEKIVRDLLFVIIKEKIVQTVTKKELQQRYECSNNGILEIPAQTMPWTEEVIVYNEGHNYSIKFVIFPYPAGGWAAQSVPPSVDEKFGQLVPFPKEWAGGNENTLPQISGIDDATFCHNGRFFARAKTKQSVIKMCEIAMNQN